MDIICPGKNITVNKSMAYYCIYLNAGYSEKGFSNVGIALPIPREHCAFGELPGI